MWYCLLCHSRFSVPRKSPTHGKCTGCGVWVWFTLGEFPPIITVEQLARSAGVVLYPPDWWTNPGTRTNARTRTADTPSKSTLAVGETKRIRMTVRFHSREVVIEGADER